MIEKVKKKMMQRKWESLKARGIFPPKSEEEKRKRLKEAHSG